ncbi:four helix bundle protein [Aliifodinibius sp. S!AR15-10]|nr:four helix bundle protein [Aliifodinibius sp. S!AR15-10]
MPKSREGRIIADQLIRSGTSVGSNYRAACRARSRKEFYAKMCIVVEEADEVLFWLQVINGSKIKEGKKLTILLKEAEEILSIVATARKTAGSNLE